MRRHHPARFVRTLSEEPPPRIRWVPEGRTHGRASYAGVPSRPEVKSTAQPHSLPPDLNADKRDVTAKVTSVTINISHSLGSGIRYLCFVLTVIVIEILTIFFGETVLFEKKCQKNRQYLKKTITSSANPKTATESP